MYWIPSDRDQIHQRRGFLAADSVDVGFGLLRSFPTNEATDPSVTRVFQGFAVFLCACQEHIEVR